MKKAELNKFIEDKTKLYKKISKIIGYSSLPEYEGLVDYTEHTKWYIDKGTLYLEIEEDECLHPYTISSYASLGERLFMGESDGYTYVMAYYEDDSYDATSIYILNNDLIDQD